MSKPLRVLHAGCRWEPLPDWFPASTHEIRLDANAGCEPDIVASVTDLGDIGEFDIVYCSHVLEHVYPHEVHKVISEFHRVLKPGGKAIIIVPDLEDAKATEDVLYVSPAGPITGLDLMYGMREMIEDNPFMAHHCGFVSDTLKQAMSLFSEIHTKRMMFNNLMGVGIK